MKSFCDRAAAEFLVPEAVLQAHWPEVRRKAQPFGALARRFKVSPIVAGRRAMDLHLIEREESFSFCTAYTMQEHETEKSVGGGDFYNNQNTRDGRTFASRVIHAARKGRIGFKQAYNLTGLNAGAFQEYAHQMGADNNTIQA